MSKKRSQPAVPKIEDRARASDGVSVTKEPPAVEAARSVRLLSIDLPVSPSDGGKIGHLEVQLDSAEGRAFRRVIIGLQAGGYRLRNGSVINSAPKAARWLFEQITDSLGRDGDG